ncbi:unnamed protein product [Rotaria sp. Silwood1]|nr:unnamed protein product [Rotaria sp. Silwood1]CAF1622883.1 unnamed protein product [Rotaria sp. Silwood1]CAF1623549.1 unnamed protein product [Rotaria sp. Silwood1]CAF3787839.1 unnamed protein product [Rotaria sp. Silwood1]CAF3824837.1 unnamed protein product [Rotaria sp. Silwood1]
MRQDRFNPSVPIVTQTDFYNSNFLKHYDKTPKTPTRSNVHKSLKELDDGSVEFQEILKTLKDLPREENAIRMYSSNHTIGTQRCYTFINEQIHEDDDDTISKLMPLIRRATNQINYNPPSNDCVVYRGINLTNDNKKLFNIGTIFRFPGFVSTSKNKEKAKSFGNTLLTIKIYSGCLQVRDISSISYFPEEEEYLFSPYSLFEVIDTNSETITLKAHDNKKKIGMDTKLPTFPKNAKLNN